MFPITLILWHTLLILSHVDFLISFIMLPGECPGVLPLVLFIHQEIFIFLVLIVRICPSLGVVLFLCLSITATFYEKLNLSPHVRYVAAPLHVGGSHVMFFNSWFYCDL